MARFEVLFTVKNIYTIPHELELRFLMIVMSASPPFFPQWDLVGCSAVTTETEI